MAERFYDLRRRRERLAARLQCRDDEVAERAIAIADEVMNWTDRDQLFVMRPHPNGRRSELIVDLEGMIGPYDD